jgi:RNA polymerase sigma-70 factor (ECF subfamily)
MTDRRHTNENDSFDADLAHILPRLRAHALSLTHSGDRSDDLVQQTALKALTGRKSFRRGTNFAGWIFRIQRNEFISELRRTRPTIDIDDEAACLPVHEPRQEVGLMMRDFLRAFRQVSRPSRQALLLAKLEGYSHKQIAKHTGVPEGTVRSRIWRGRATLERLLEARPSPLPTFHPGTTNGAPTNVRLPEAILA